MKNFGSCPKCAAYATSTWRHIGAPVICPAGHMWFSNTDVMASGPKDTLEEAKKRIPVPDVPDTPALPTLQHIKNYLINKEENLTDTLFDIGKRSIIKDVLDIIDLGEEK